MLDGCRGLLKLGQRLSEQQHGSVVKASSLPDGEEQ